MNYSNLLRPLILIVAILGSLTSGFSQSLILEDNCGSNTSLQLYAGFEAAASNNGNQIVLEGGTSSLWTTTGTEANYEDAFNTNTYHRASASTTIEAGSYSDLELQIKFKQKAGTSLMNSWFRVLVNGAVQSDLCGNFSYNPHSFESDSFRIVSFNLSTFGGTNFVLSLQSSCKLNGIDQVIIDEVRLYNSNNATAIELPYSSDYDDEFLAVGQVIWDDSTGYTWNFGSLSTLVGTSPYIYTQNIAMDNILSNTKLFLPAIDFYAQNNCSIQFSYASDHEAYLVGIVGNDLDFTDTLYTLNSTSGSWQNTSIDLSNFTNGQICRFAFTYEDPIDQSSFFALDSILISSTNNSQVDLEMLGIISPIPQSSYSTSETVSLRVKNNSPSAIANYSIHFQLDSNSVVSESITSPLASGDSIDLSFTNNIDLGSIGDYTLVAWVNTAYDIDATNNNDTLSISVTIPIISSYPYQESFEGAHYWTSGGQASDWMDTIPNGSVISSASNGDKAWVTNMNGAYGFNQQSWVKSPKFNFSNLTNPELQIDFICHTTNFQDGASIQYSLDEGSSWSNIGAYGDANNWFNSSSIMSLYNLNGGPGWTGDLYSAWTTATHSIANLAGESSVIFRVIFGSQYNFSGFEGFAFDNFIIKDIQAYDPGIVSIDYPMGNCVLNVEEPVVITVKNEGQSSIAGFIASFSTDGLNFISESVSQTIAPGAEYQYTFNQLASFNSSTGYNLYVEISHPQDGYFINNELSLSEDYIPDAILPFFEDFESGSLPSNWKRENELGANGWLITDDYASQYFPIPSHTTYAASNDDSCYCNSMNDLLITPNFDLSDYTSFTLNFDAYYTGQFSSSAVVMVSVDCGFSWTEVYYVPSNVVNWQNLTVDLSSYTGEPKVKIAFKHSDNNTWATGFAIDNVSLYGTSSVATQDIPLGSGWGIISTYILPTDSSTVAVCSDIVQNLTILKNDQGQVYWPTFNLVGFPYFETAEGYQILMTSSDTLSVTGEIIDPATTVIELDQNWNILGYIRTSNMSIETAMNPLSSTLIIVKDEDGQVYWPIFGVDLINEMQPGKGYQIKLSASSSFSYPPN